MWKDILAVLCAIGVAILMIHTAIALSVFTHIISNNSTVLGVISGVLMTVTIALSLIKLWQDIFKGIADRLIESGLFDEN